MQNLSFQLGFGHSGTDPLQTGQERAGAIRKLGEVWWKRRHHEITQLPRPCNKAVIWLPFSCYLVVGKMAKVESKRLDAIGQERNEERA